VKPSEIIKRACNFLGGDLKTENLCVIKIGDSELMIEKARIGNGLNFEIFKRTRKKDTAGNVFIQDIGAITHNYVYGAKTDKVDCYKSDKYNVCVFSDKDDWVRISKLEETDRESVSIDVMHKGTRLGSYYISEELEV